MRIEHLGVPESTAMLKKQNNEGMSRGYRSQLNDFPMAKA